MSSFRLDEALKQAVTLLKKGRLEDAQRKFAEARNLAEGAPDPLKKFGNTVLQHGLLEVGIEALDASLRLAPFQFDVLRQRAMACGMMKRYQDVVATCEQALRLDRNQAEFWHIRGIALADLKRDSDALASFDMALSLKPHDADALFQRGRLLRRLQRHEETVATMRKVLSVSPKHVAALTTSGLSLMDLGRPGEALAVFDKAIALDPKNISAHFCRGLMLRVLRREVDAIASFDRVLSLDPRRGRAYLNKGLALLALQKRDLGIESLEKALELASPEERPDILPDLVHARLYQMRWDDFEQHVSEIEDVMASGEIGISPFVALGLTSRASSLLSNIKKFSQKISSEVQCQSPLPPRQNTNTSPRLRIGYFSCDFHNHATMHLMAEMFEHHDKSRFEIHAFDMGRKTNDPWRHRAIQSFEAFHELGVMSDEDVWSLSNTLEIDIAVDLKGFTADSRPSLFARRFAPIQVNYLGFPGTMGLPPMDYLIADKVIIPDSLRAFYTEKIVRLPGSYQVNCRHRDIASSDGSRASHGLPAGIVYSSFNNPWKIHPRIFASWLKILKAVDGSALWMYVPDKKAREHLRKVAESDGVDPERIVLAEHVPVEVHLSRLRHADIMLDTYPCNAHTTASDALRMGVPVLTFTGEAFASRVAASLLHAVGLPELVTSSLEEYEAMAIKLGREPERLKALRQKLADLLPQAPLFDSLRTTRAIEAAYAEMARRSGLGLPPDHIDVTEEMLQSHSSPLPSIT